MRPRQTSTPTSLGGGAMGLIAVLERRELVLRTVLVGAALCSVWMLPKAGVSRTLSLHENAMMPGQASTQLTKADRDAINAYGEHPRRNAPQHQLILCLYRQPLYTLHTLALLIRTTCELLE
jgi:hypothetical protein